MTENEKDEQAVLAAINAAGTPLGGKDIQAVTGLPYERVRRATSRLYRQRAIKRVEGNGAERPFSRWLPVHGA